MAKPPAWMKLLPGPRDEMRFRIRVWHPAWWLFLVTTLWRGIAHAGRGEAHDG